MVLMAVPEDGVWVGGSGVEGGGWGGAGGAADGVRFSSVKFNKLSIWTKNPIRYTPCPVGFPNVACQTHSSNVRLI